MVRAVRLVRQADIDDGLTAGTPTLESEGGERPRVARIVTVDSVNEGLCRFGKRVIAGNSGWTETPKRWRYEC